MKKNNSDNLELIPFNPKTFTELVDFIAEHGRIEIHAEENDWAPGVFEDVSVSQVEKRRKHAKTESEARWAWCCVHVTVFFIDGYKGSSALGGCSFGGVESFRNSWQFEKLIKEAAEDCAQSMYKKAKKIVAICEGK